MKLDGIKILDMARFLPSSYDIMFLADLGAEVVRIEDPEIRDYARYKENLYWGYESIFHDAEPE